MYDSFIQGIGYISEFIAFLWASIINILSFFAPSQPGFPLVVVAIALILGKYGCRALQRRNYLRSARILMRTIQGFAAIVICLTIFQVIQLLYPLVVKAVSTFK